MALQDELRSQSRSTLKGSAVAPPMPPPEPPFRAESRQAPKGSIAPVPTPMTPPPLAGSSLSIQPWTPTPLPSLGKGAPVTVAQGDANEAKLKDPNFVQSELIRTQNVIGARQAQNLGTELQDSYLKRLQGLANPTPQIPPPPIGGAPSLGAPTPDAQKLGADAIGYAIDSKMISADKVRENAAAAGIDLSTQFGGNAVTGLSEAPDTMPKPPIDDPQSGGGKPDTPAIPDAPKPPTDQQTFDSYLQDNGAQTLSRDEIAAQAKRLRDMQVNGQISRIMQERDTARQRNLLAQQQASTGKDAALNDLDIALRQGMSRAQAMAIRNGLTASNIPWETDIQPLLYNYSKERGAVEQGIQNKIDQLKLEAVAGDQDAVRQLVELERQGGLIESSSLQDLTREERNFGETVRGNRFGEYAGLEGIARQGRQDEFGNDMARAGLGETIRSNKAGEGFRERDLTRLIGNDKFSQDLAGKQFDEGVKQNLIGNVRADRGMDYTEWLGKNNLDLEGRRLTNSETNAAADRDLANKRYELEKEENPFRRALLEAQVKQAEAAARRDDATANRGGYTPNEADEIASDVLAIVSGLPGQVASGKMTPEVAKGVTDVQRQRYDGIYGTGSFDRSMGGMVNGLQGGTTSRPEDRYGASVGASERTRMIGDADQVIKDAETRVTELEDLYVMYRDNPEALFALTGLTVPNALPALERARKNLDEARKKRGALGN